MLYKDGAGLLPVELGATVGDAALKKSSYGFAPLQYKHSIVEAFRDTTDAVRAGLMGVRTWEFQKLSIPKGSSAVVALGFDDGLPAIVEAPAPRPSDRRRDLDRRGLDQLALAQQLSAGHGTDHARSGVGPQRGTQRARRSTLGTIASLGAAETIATVATPGGRERTLKLKAAGDVSRLLFEETDLSGVYQVRSGPPIALDASFAVNPDPLESDPTKLDRAALAASLPNWNFAYFNNWQGLTADAAAVGRRGELHRYFLYGVLALLLIESVLAWIFGHHS